MTHSADDIFFNLDSDLVSGLTDQAPHDSEMGKYFVLQLDPACVGHKDSSINSLQETYSEKTTQGASGGDRLQEARVKSKRGGLCIAELLN